MGDFSLQDTVGQALALWSQREQAKIGARLVQSREQILAYEQAAKSSNPQAYGTAGSPAWLLPVMGVGLLGLVVYWAVK